MLGKLFRHKENKIKSSTIKYSITTIKEQIIGQNNCVNDDNDNKGILNSYLQESLKLISNNKLQTSQTNIIESINQVSHSMILCDEFSGRKYSCLLGVLNRIINRKDEEKESETSSESEEFFVNSMDAYKVSKAKADENLIKKYIKPRGALIICQKFEFATHFYRICRKLDFKNKLKMIRLGTSLHTVTPTVEIDSKSITDSEDERMEVTLGNLNLINTTYWKNIDILFITPQMLEYVFSQKDEYDYYDINPEIIMIDDFDYILKTEIYDVKNFLLRFLGSNTKFSGEYSLKRKLVLTSSTLPTSSLIPKNSFIENLDKSIENYKNYFTNINQEIYNKIEVIISPYFMNLDYHLKDIKINVKIFEGEFKILFDKKFKYIQHLIENETLKTVICCSESNISTLKDYFKRKKIKFTSVDESDRVGVRLFSFMLYNKYDYDLLLITPIFLKSLQIVKLDQLILFDFPSDNNNLIRMLAKFPRVENKKHSLHLLCSSNDIETNVNIVDYLNKYNK